MARFLSQFSEENLEHEDTQKPKDVSDGKRETADAEHSFHHKRHSSYILDLYQRLRSQSNPPSPDTLAKIDRVSSFLSLKFDLSLYTLKSYRKGCRLNGFLEV